MVQGAGCKVQIQCVRDTECEDYKAWGAGCMDFHRSSLVS